jgi:hypothetical protein
MVAMNDPLPLRGSTSEPPESKTIDVIYDHLKDVAEQQLGDQASIDGKVVQVFAVASVVVGLSGINAASAAANPGLVTALLLVGLGAYLAVAVVSATELWTREFKTLRFGATLWENEWDVPPEEVKVAVIEKAGPAYEHNRKKIQAKGALLAWALMLTGVEVAFVVGSIVARIAGS